MPKSFYTVKEAAEKLICTAEDLKVLVSRGDLREFRDGDEANFKVTEVDALHGDNKQFQYEAMTSGGDIAHGITDAASPEEAMVHIRKDMELIPIRVREIGPGHKPKSKPRTPAKDNVRWWMGFGITSCVVAVIEAIIISRYFLDGLGK